MTYTNGATSHAATIERLPPHSIEAEEGVLGSIIIDPDAIYEVMDFLRPEDFYRTQNRWVYEACLSLARRQIPIDFLTVTDELRGQEQLEEMGGEAYIIGLITAVPTSINARHYGRSVEAKAIRRRLIGAASQIANAAWNEGENIQGTIGNAQKALFSVVDSWAKDDIRTPQDCASGYLEQLDKLRNHTGDLLGISTGFYDLDKVLNGLQPILYTLAGRPGMGKSAIGIGIADHVALRLNKNVALFSLEMSVKQIMDRRVASATRLALREKIQRPWTMTEGEIIRVNEAVGRLSQSNLFIDATPALTPQQIKAKSMRLHAQHGLDLIIIDHLHLMGADVSRPRNDLELSDITKSLAGLSKELNCPVLLLAQLSRGVESRMDKHPLLSDLRGAGGIEENSRCVIFIYRDEYYNDATPTPNICELDIAKQNEGPTGAVSLYWNSKLASVSNLQRDEIDLGGVPDYRKMKAGR